MHWHGLIILDVFVLSCIARSSLPTPPAFVARGHTRPSNIKNCRIHAKSVYPWIVGVWDSLHLNYVGLGSMITYVAFVTTCRQYTASLTAYKAVAQFIWNVSHPDQPCMQEKKLTTIHKHPSCIKSQKDATFFDFAVFILRDPFDISGYTYPTATFPRNPLELIGLISYLDETPETVDCLLPRFRNQKENPPRFNWETFVQAVPFHSTCVELLCEKDPDDQRFSEMCRKRLGQRANCTMLCMRNRNEETITLGVRGAYWYAGAPLTCNGTAYGIAAQPKIRHNFKSPPSYDIHFVITFIRCWIWLGQHIIKHAPKWKDTVYVQDLTAKPVSIPSPNTPFPPTMPYYFYEWDTPLEDKNDANSQFAYFKYTISHIILSLLISNHR